MKRLPISNVMARAAEKATVSLIRDFGEIENLQSSPKNSKKFLDIAYNNIAKKLANELLDAKPDWELCVRGKSVYNQGAELRFIVDPLCGSVNFANGIPHFAITIAAAFGNKMIASLILDPCKDECFWAEKGNGAYLNDRRLRVSQCQHLKDALCATSFTNTKMMAIKKTSDLNISEAMTALLHQIKGVQSWGVFGLDLAWVAAGRYDACWQSGLQFWQSAAGTLLVQEAGGFIHSPQLSADKNISMDVDIMATNQYLFEHVRKSIA